MSDKPTDEQPAFFVSRRGRQVGLHQLDMSDIDIDTDTTTPSPEVKKSKPNRQPKPSKKPVVKASKVPKTPQSPRQRRTWSRRSLVIIATLVVLLIALPVIAGEAVAGQYRTGASGAKHNLAKLVETTVLPAQKKSTVSSEQLRTIANKVNDIVGSMCRGGLLDNAAGIYPRANRALTECKAAQAKYSALANGLYELEGQTRYLEKLDACVKPITTPITDGYAVLGAQQELWGTASDCISNLSPPSKTRTAHGALATHVSKVRDAWLRLSTANGAQDGEGFTEAEKVLASEYEAVRASAPGFAGAVQAAQTAVTAAYNDLK